MKKRLKVNNEIYEEYGERWYHDQNDPVALLRAEGEFKNAWILSNIDEKKPQNILDLGCGGGFLSNALAKKGHVVTGVDISESSLQIAKKYDETKSVTYIKSDVHHLPFDNQTFDIVCAMDLLEHIEKPENLIAEINRILRPGGIIYFHTFNRNTISHLVIIKLVEWLVPNTPKNLHVIDYFIKPQELKCWLQAHQMDVKFIKGIKPVVINRALWMSIFKRKVLPGIKFEWTKSLITSYAGFAQKI